MTDFPQIPGYRIDRELGRGGMARVYLAVEEKLDRQVALKVLLPSLAETPHAPERFIKEARTAARLQHSGIIAIYDVGQSAGAYFMAMEYLSDGTLKEKIAAGPLPVTTALSVLRQVASALDFAHAKGFIHRDIKPENIMFREDGSAVLSDFGIAKAVGEAARLTMTGMSVGTPRYMSPEQIRGFALDGRSDLYSLGIVFFEMLTGKVPYDAADAIAVCMQHVQDPLPQLAGGLQVFQPLLERMLAKDPADRVPTGAGVVRLMQEHAAAEPLLASPVSDKKIIAPRGIADGLQRSSPVQPGSSGEGKAGSLPEHAVSSRRLPLVLGLAGMLIVLVLLLLLIIPRGEKRGEGPAATIAQKPRMGADAMPSGQVPLRIEMVLIPAGSFVMGSEKGEWDEKPEHRVTINSFYMGKYEVTQQQWKTVMGSNPSRFAGSGDCPVEQVSWESVQEFIRRLNESRGEHYRLPTEAEWEYACRAATTGDRYGDLAAIAWFNFNSGGRTHLVGMKSPNSFGLHDMLGNVAEWCQDLYGSDYYRYSPAKNPAGNTVGAVCIYSSESISGVVRVYRGGSWNSGSASLRAANRESGCSQGFLPDDLGFRLAKNR